MHYCYVSSRHQLGAACQTKRPISLAPWEGNGFLFFATGAALPMVCRTVLQDESWKCQSNRTAVSPESGGEVRERGRVNLQGNGPGRGREPWLHPRLWF